MPTKQETFDAVVTHLLKQGCRSVDSLGNCVYLSDQGLKCAAGCLIPEDEYVPGWEGTSIWENEKCEGTVTACLRRLGYNLKLVSQLQSIHDNCEPHRWDDAFQQLAAEHGLTYTPPTESA